MFFNVFYLQINVLNIYDISGGARPGRARSNDLAVKLPPWLPTWLPPWLSFFYSAAALLAM